MLGFSWSWGWPQPWSKLYNLSALFLASEAARMWHLHIWQGIIRLTIATIPFSWFFFCHVEHCQLTTCSVWHEGLPDHFRPCQNTWAPHYAAAHDWLKSKGVSTLTDRSGVVYCIIWVISVCCWVCWTRTPSLLFPVVGISCSLILLLFLSTEGWGATNVMWWIINYWTHFTYLFKFYWIIKFYWIQNAESLLFMNNIEICLMTA